MGQRSCINHPVGAFGLCVEEVSSSGQENRIAILFQCIRLDHRARDSALARDARDAPIARTEKNGAIRSPTHLQSRSIADLLNASGRNVYALELARGEKREMLAVR